MFGSFTPAMATPYVEGSPSSGYMSPYYNTASGSGSAASPGIYQSMSPSYVSMSPSRSMAGGDGQGFRMGSPQFNPRRLVHCHCHGLSLIVIVYPGDMRFFSFLSLLISHLLSSPLLQYCVLAYLTGLLSDVSGLQSDQVMDRSSIISWSFCIMLPPVSVVESGIWRKPILFPF